MKIKEMINKDELSWRLKTFFQYSMKCIETSKEKLYNDAVA